MPLRSGRSSSSGGMRTPCPSPALCSPGARGQQRASGYTQIFAVRAASGRSALKWEPEEQSGGSRDRASLGDGRNLDLGPLGPRTQQEAVVAGPSLGWVAGPGGAGPGAVLPRPLRGWLGFWFISQFPFPS